MKRSIFILIAFLMLINLQGQELKGTVIDTDGNPLEKTYIYFKGKYIDGVYTNNDGFFSIGNIEPNSTLVVDNKKYGSRFFEISTLDPNNLNTIKLGVRVYGSVYNTDYKSLRNIVVEVVGRNMTKLTDSSGYFEFNDLGKTDTLYVYDKESNWLAQRRAVNLTAYKQEFHLTRQPKAIPSNSKEGIAYLDDKTPKIKGDIPRASEIRSIKLSQDEAMIKPRGASKRSLITAQFNSILSLSKVGRMPTLQNTYSQGQGDKWIGPENNEAFSWGLPISSLEYTGTDYPYNKNGSLTLKGKGNGSPAKSYDAKSFFRTGVSFSNSLTVSTPILKEAALSLSLNQNKTNSPIRNAYSDIYYGNIGIKSIKTGSFTSDVAILFNSTYNRLPNNGANYARIMQSVLTTPPTFDNANGMSAAQAAKNSESWLLNNGSQRSYDPQNIKNPYYLINELPDKTKNENMLVYGKTKFRKNNWIIENNLSFQKNWIDETIGINQTSTNKLQRDEQASTLNYNLIGQYLLNKYEYSLTFKTEYNFSHNDEKIDRLGFDQFHRIRNVHNIKYKASYENNYRSGKLHLYLANKHYFSNTADNYVNLFPSAGVSVYLTDLINNWLDEYRFGYIRVFGSASRSLGETPLIYRNSAVLTTKYTSSDALKNYYEDRDIVFDSPKMTPEIYLNTEVGISANLNHKFSFELSFFRNTTWNSIAPVETNNDFKLDNIGRFHNYGYLIGTSFQFGYNRYNRLMGNIALNFSQIKNKVTSLSEGREKVALAGFSNTGVYFAKNEPLGTIYGTTYKRNENGQIIIGSDGFPLVDTEIKKIGDPTPSFVLNLTPSLSWKNFDFSFVLEYSHGGDKWNGTKAYLDYLGMSQSTATDRNIRNYIFNGVDINNQTNTQGVDFYNPSLPISENRWVRYGSQGVSEAYIEDASYLRLSDISLTYNIVLKKGTQRKLRIGIHAQNLFVISSYKGVDPTSNLFGYATAKGLDLFNMPTIRNYELSLGLTF